MEPLQITETALNLVSTQTRIEGKVVFDQVTRVHGTLVGEVEARPGSTLILGESALVEGNIMADTLLIEGYVKGDVEARTKVVIAPTGRVLGNIKTPSLEIDFGAHFEGRCEMERSTKGAAPAPA